MSNIYAGEGSDSTGVVTRLLSVNGSLRISVYNSATFYGIHVSSTPINLVYSDITVATGQVINRITIPLKPDCSINLIRQAKIIKRTGVICVAVEKVFSAEEESPERRGEYSRNKSALVRCRIQSGGVGDGRRPSSVDAGIRNEDEGRRGGKIGDDKAPEKDLL